MLGCTTDRWDDPLPDAPSTIFVADLDTRDEVPVLGIALPVTRREGYDNQPAFTADGRAILYTSRRGDDVEIYRYDLESGETGQVTRTRAREYSAAPLPGGDGFSVVRVEAVQHQVLWRYDVSGGEVRPLLEQVQDVDYYAWVDPTTVVIVQRADTPRLVVAHLDSGLLEPVESGVGRSVSLVPGRRAVSFVHRVADGESWLKQLDLDSGAIEPLVRTRPDSEFHAWTPSGTLLMGQGSRLFAWRPGEGDSWERWREVADLADAGLRRITRIAVSPTGDRLALVNGGPD
jgi:hypothetical protein